MHKDKPMAARTDWVASVGSIHSRNNLLAASESRLIVSTSGLDWNIQDPSDGIYCLDTFSGRVLWFARTKGDANEISLVGGWVVAPTDAGEVQVISLDQGQTEHVHHVGSPVFGKPHTVEHFGDWTASFVAHNGSVWILTDRGANCRQVGEIKGRVRATPAPLNDGSFVIASEEGDVFRCSFHRNGFSAHKIASLEYMGFGAAGQSQPAVISAKPLVHRNRIYLGFARDTYYDELPLVCLDPRGGIIWHNGRVRDLSIFDNKNPGFGNVRTTPLLAGGRLIVTPAYSDSVYFLDPNTGIVRDRVRLGQNVFQQWASPVAIGSKHVAVGRVDGVLSVIDIVSTRLAASISLATPETETVTRHNAGKPYPADYSLLPGEVPVGGICGTPTVVGRRIYVGTTSGQLASIALKMPRF